MDGKLIVIEGACDGVGKSRQTLMLHQFLESKNISHLLHHFPTYGSMQGKPVEEYLKGSFGSPNTLNPYFVHMLYANDRAITWQKILKKQFDSGKLILLDRYTTSSLIYQSALIDNENEKRKFIDYVVDIEYNKLGLPKPNKVIFLTIPFELATELRREREQQNSSKDIHEQDLIFMKKVYDSAQYVADYLGWTKIECSNNGKMKPVDEINKDILTALFNRDVKDSNSAKNNKK